MLINVNYLDRCMFPALTPCVSEYDSLNSQLGNIKKRPLPCKLSDNFGEPEFDIDTSTGARGRDQPGKPRVLVRVRVGLGTGVRVDQWGAG